MTDSTFLIGVDLARFMVGAITAEMVFVAGSMPRREQFLRRVMCVVALCVVWCWSYFPGAAACCDTCCTDSE